jgi:amino acid adenylation domain-containing protein
MILLSVFNILISKLSGQEDIIIGTPVAARRHADLEKIIGFFVNTLPMRNYPRGGNTFKEFLGEVKEQTLAAYENQEYQFEELVDKISVRRDISRNPIFDVMFNLINPSDHKNTIAVNEEENEYKYENVTSKFDMNLTAVEQRGQVYFSLEYSTKLFKLETIERFIKYFKNILLTLAKNKNPDLKLSGIQIIPGDERKELLKFSQGISENFGKDETIHRLFEKKAEKKPGAVALVFESEMLTYKELNRRANQLACVLRKKGAAPDIAVGLLVERSFDMIIGILAALKAGGAYLPIDPGYPEQRKKYMLEDSGVKLLLTNYNTGDAPGDIQPGVETLDISDGSIYIKDSSNPKHINRGDDLVYIIYTSGSTGKPKGVMIEHKNVVNLVKFSHKYTNIDYTRILQFHTIGFDVSFQEISCTLLFGGRLLLIDDSTRSNINELFELVKKHQIKTLFLPMSFLKIIFADEETIKCIPGCVEHIQAAGEQVIINDRFKEYLRDNHVYLHNHYGPAETHVVTTLTIYPQENIPGLPSIGKPILNTGIYILDKVNHLVPIGVIGELYVGGSQVGRGYLGKSEITAERFTTNPFIKGERIYKTGDLARWLSDGSIEFLGRIDNQVKIRGFRIEPGEIESQLANHKDIREAVVVVRQDERSDRYLCAYFVPRSAYSLEETTLSQANLRKYLSRCLPNYMIPSYFTMIEKMPLNPNGKILRRALPEPVIKSRNKYTPPTNEMEEQLRVIWSEVLDMEKEIIGIEDNFFERGGHSLIAITLIAKINKEFSVQLPLSELFKTPTIKGLSLYIKRAAENRFLSIEAAEEREYYSLSSAQKRLYVMQQIEPESTTYNMPTIIILEGKLNRGHIEKTFSELIHRHESLRTSFDAVNDQPVQRIQDKVEFEIEDDRSLVNCQGRGEVPSPIKVEKIIRDFIRPFDLAQVPQLRVGLIKTNEHQHILMADTHHIISDAISNGILINELVELYIGEKLPALRLQYKDFSQWQNSRIISGRIKKQEDYWLNEFKGKLPVFNIPTDYKRPLKRSLAGSRETFNIPGEEAEKLRTLSKKEHATMFMVLLTLYNILLFKLTDQEDIIVGTIIAGRSHLDLENIIGVFVNALALRNYPKGDKPFSEFLREVRKRTLDAFDNQDYQFEDLVEKLMVERDPSRNPLFDVLFSFRARDANRNREPDPGPAEKEREPHLNVKAYTGEQGTEAKFDMIFTGGDTGEELFFVIEYSTGLFKKETIERFIKYFKEILSTVLSSGSIQLKNIKISHDLVMAASTVYQSSESEFDF